MTLDNLMSLNEAAAQRISMDAADADGRTPAHLAAANGHLGVLKVGVQLGTAAARCTCCTHPAPAHANGHRCHTGRHLRRLPPWVAW
jgi:hypothetical protein